MPRYRPRCPSLSRPVAIRYCSTPGCTELVEQDASGRLGRYCQKIHQFWGEEGCIACRNAERFGDSEFCYPCDKAANLISPLIVAVPHDHKIYDDISNQFQKTWRHPTTCPPVRAIYRVVADQSVLERYNGYLNEVESRGSFASRGLTFGNQLRYWHGTDRNCNIGDPGQTYLCGSAACSLCCILRSSFEISCAKKKTGWGRFGLGIYTSSTSSKSNDYSANVGSSTKWKAMVLAHVAAGNAVKYTVNHPSLTEPPVGYDSVIGEPSSSGHLNYDELVVYNDNAVCPAYLVMYDST